MRSDGIGIVHETAAVFHDEGRAAEILDVRQRLEEHLRLRGDFSDVHRGQRAVGVVYREECSVTLTE